MVGAVVGWRRRLTLAVWLLKIGVLVLLFIIARIFIRKPEYVVKFTAFMVPPIAYPEQSYGRSMAELMQENPREWLVRNPASAQVFRRMGYMLYIIVGGGTFIGVCQLADLAARVLIGAFMGNR